MLIVYIIQNGDLVNRYIYVRFSQNFCTKYSGIQSQFESYQRLKKTYLTLSIIRYVSRVIGEIQRKELRWSRYWKGSLQVAIDYSRPTLYIYIYIYIYRRTRTRTRNSIIQCWRQNQSARMPMNRAVEKLRSDIFGVISVFLLLKVSCYLNGWIRHWSFTLLSDVCDNIPVYRMKL